MQVEARMNVATADKTFHCIPVQITSATTCALRDESKLRSLLAAEVFISKSVHAAGPPPMIGCCASCCLPLVRTVWRYTAAVQAYL